MEKPFPAYEGTEPFVFVCYAHLDAEKVYPDLVLLKAGGINLWYDEGISAGVSWRSEIAAAIKNAATLVFFISPASLKSNHCLREVDYALNHDIDIIPVYLEAVPLPPELALVLNRVQGLYREKDARYMERLQKALQVGAGISPFGTAPRHRRFNLLAAAVVAIVAAGTGFALLRDDSFLGNDSSGQIVASDPGAFDLYLDGMQLMERWDKDDNLDKSIANFRQALVLDPDFALAYARLADALRIQNALSGDAQLLDEALAAINQALARNENLAPVQVVLGKIQSAQGNIDLANASFEKALQIDPNDASANFAIARVYERQGKLQEAEDAMRRSINLQPDDLLNLDGFAGFYFRHDKFDLAAEQWRKVIRLAPDHFAALLNLGTTLVQTGDVAEAITMYEQAISIRPTYMAWTNLGSTLTRAARYEEGVTALQNAIALNATDWLAFGNLGYAYAWMGGMDAEARAAFEQAIQIAEETRQQDGRDPYVHSDLALYYAMTQQAELARERIATAMALSPDTIEILFAAVEVFENLGERDTAVQHLVAALDLGLPVRQLLANRELAELLQDSRVADLLQQ